MSEKRIVLTGFMGVGKSTVARRLARLLGTNRVDLDHYIERSERRKIAEIIETDGLEKYREIESRNLEHLLENDIPPILSLGGGTWTVKHNRVRIKEKGFTSIWLESSFEHCWYNIKFSKKERPLAKDKAAAQKLFEDRQKVYCLADWHFIVRPDQTSVQVAEQIMSEVFL